MVVDRTPSRDFAWASWDCFWSSFDCRSWAGAPPATDSTPNTAAAAASVSSVARRRAWGRLSAVHITRSDAYGVSCRARAEQIALGPVAPGPLDLSPRGDLVPPLHPPTAGWIRHNVRGSVPGSGPFASSP